MIQTVLQPFVNVEINPFTFSTLLFPSVTVNTSCVSGAADVCRSQLSSFMFCSFGLSLLRAGPDACWEMCTEAAAVRRQDVVVKFPAQEGAAAALHHILQAAALHASARSTPSSEPRLPLHVCRRSSKTWKNFKRTLEVEYESLLFGV